MYKFLYTKTSVLIYVMGKIEQTINLQDNWHGKTLTLFLTSRKYDIVDCMIGWEPIWRLSDEEKNICFAGSDLRRYQSTTNLPHCPR